MTISALISVVWHAGREAHRDQITMVAASVAFFVLLAIFPGLAAIVSVYSAFADPEKGGAIIAALPTVLPEQAVEIIARQTMRVSEQKGAAGSNFNFVPLLGFAVLIWSAMRGIRSLLNALNVVYDTEERRGYIELTAISLAFTIGFVAFLLFVIAMVFVLPAIFITLGLGSDSSMILTLLRWPVLLIVVALSLALIYRFGSNRDNARWRWITTGSCVASVLWVCSSILFEWAVSRFGSFDQLYGSLSTVIGFMIWIWISTIVVLFGAEIDAAVERRGNGGTANGAIPSAFRSDRRAQKLTGRVGRPALSSSVSSG